MSNIDRIQRNYEIGKHWVTSYVDGYKTQTIPRDTNLFRYAPNAVMYAARVGETEMMEELAAANFDEIEAKVFWAMVPDWRATHYEIYPSEEGVLVWTVFEGTVADNARSRSLDLAGKTLRFDEVDVFLTNEDFEIVRRMCHGDINQCDAVIQLCMGVSAFQPAAADDYSAAMARLAAGQPVVDPDQPTAPIPPSRYWLADGKLVPMPAE
ncbi:MAG: hypothetical protein QM605_12320 [Sphingobium sp.]